MLNDWFEFEAYRTRTDEDMLVLELHHVTLRRSIEKWKAGTKFEWIVIDLFGGGVTIRERTERIVDHPMLARFGIARKWQNDLWRWNQSQRMKAHEY